MNGSVGWHFDNETMLIRPVAKIVEQGNPMVICCFVRNEAEKIVAGRTEQIAQTDYFGAPVFVFCRITGANRWLLDERNLHIRPVAAVLESRRPKEKTSVCFVAGKGEKSDMVSIEAHEVLYDIHSNAFQRLARLLQGEK